MSAALQVYYHAFDAAFFDLSRQVRSRIERKIDDLSLRLDTFPHEHLTGVNRYRLRVGDYRVVYTFDTEQGVIYLLAVGHRRDIYRKR